MISERPQPEETACESCGRVYRTDASYRGQAFRCHCGEIVDVPPNAGQGPHEPRPAPPPRLEVGPGPPPPAPVSSQGVLVFVLGLVGIFSSCLCGIGPVLSIVALVIGLGERRRLRTAARPSPGLLTAGWILALIGTGLGLVYVAVVALGLLLG